MNVTVKPLAHVANVIRGVTFSKIDASLEPRSNTLPVLRAGNIQESLILDDDLVFVEQSKINKIQLLRANDIIMCTSSGSINVLGKTALVKEPWEGSFGAFCAVIRAREEKCVPSYLYHYLNTPQFLRWVRKSDGINIKNIRKSDLDAQLVPLPPLEEQKRIAAILDKADGIRRRRQQAMAMADEFLRSVFLDMFGDPVTNPKRWKTEEMKKIGKVTTGNTPSRSIPEYYGDSIEWIKSDNINTPSHYLTKATEGLSLNGKAVGRTVGKDAILVTCIAGSPDCIGNLALADREVAFNQQINALETNDRVDALFMYSQLMVGKKLIQKASTNSMKGMVSKGKFELIPVMVPPMDMQLQFSRIFCKQMKMVQNMELHSEQGERSFSALAQELFSGRIN